MAVVLGSLRVKAFSPLAKVICRFLSAPALLTPSPVLTASANSLKNNRFGCGADWRKFNTRTATISIRMNKTSELRPRGGLTFFLPVDLILSHTYSVWTSNVIIPYTGEVDYRSQIGQLGESKHAQSQRGISPPTARNAISPNATASQSMRSNALGGMSWGGGLGREVSEAVAAASGGKPGGT